MKFDGKDWAILVLCLVLIAVVIAFAVVGATQCANTGEVSGTVDSSRTWRGRVLIKGPVLVEDGVDLNIEDGTIIELASGTFADPNSLGTNLSTLIFASGSRLKCKRSDDDSLYGNFTVQAQEDSTNFSNGGLYFFGTAASMQGRSSNVRSNPAASRASLFEFNSCVLIRCGALETATMSDFNACNFVGMRNTELVCDSIASLSTIAAAVVFIASTLSIPRIYASSLVDTTVEVAYGSSVRVSRALELFNSGEGAIEAEDSSTLTILAGCVFIQGGVTPLVPPAASGDPNLVALIQNGGVDDTIAAVDTVVSAP